MSRKNVKVTFAPGIATGATKQTGAMKMNRITRDEIRSIPVIHKSIQRDKEQLRFLREKATSVPSGISDRERVQTSPSNDGNRYIEEAADLDRDIRAKENRLKTLQTQAKAFIRSLPVESEKDRLTIKVLKHRYLNCYSWDDTADLIGYDIRWLRRLEQQAVSNLY